MGQPLTSVPKITVNFAVATMSQEVDTILGTEKMNPGDYLVETQIGFQVLNPTEFADCYRIISEDNGEGTAELILPGEEGYAGFAFER